MECGIAPPTMVYYLPMRKKEILSFVAKQIELEYITLSDISQTQKDKYHLFCHKWKLKEVTLKVEK
jgi:hypothetical protein